jgi:hypothetical protein
LDYVELAQVVFRIPSLVGGAFCRATQSGLMCDEDPDDPMMYYIHEGTDKFVETHMTMAPNYELVYFVDNPPNLIQCDYRPGIEYQQRTGAALHIYLAVPDAARHKQRFDGFDATAHWSQWQGGGGNG